MCAKCNCNRRFMSRGCKAAGEERLNIIPILFLGGFSCTSKKFSKRINFCSDAIYVYVCIALCKIPPTSTRNYCSRTKKPENTGLELSVRTNFALTFLYFCICTSLHRYLQYTLNNIIYHRHMKYYIHSHNQDTI